MLTNYRTSLDESETSVNSNTSAITASKNRKKKSPSIESQQMDPLATSNNGERTFFSPSPVSEELLNGVASCAKTCLTYLRYDGSLEEISPPNDC